MRKLYGLDNNTINTKSFVKMFIDHWVIVRRPSAIGYTFYTRHKEHRTLRPWYPFSLHQNETNAKKTKQIWNICRYLHLAPQWVNKLEEILTVSEVFSFKSPKGIRISLIDRLIHGFASSLVFEHRSFPDVQN